MKKKIAIAVAMLLSSIAQAKPYDIAHVEPLNWWVGMKHPELQIMVHGESIADLTPEISYPGVKLINVERTNNKNYLFINLLVTPQAKAGTLNIAFKRGKETIQTQAYALQQRRKDSALRRGFDSHDSIYLIVPDRFSNGDPLNDTKAGMPDVTDRKQPSARHGGDIKGMQNHLDYIRDMGFTMIWPTPLLENNQKQYSYHGYALTDYYKIDARFGSNEDYRNFVKAANQQGLGVIQDIVVNHIGTRHWWMKDLPDVDWINYQQQGYTQTNNRHITVQDPHAAPEDRKLFLDGWFDTAMPDMNQRNPRVAKYLMQNSVWWVEYADLSGIREDTYSYADPTFLKNWSNYVLDEYPHLNIVGEEMDDHPYLVAYWQKGVINRDGYQSGLPTVMDFPVVDAMPAILTEPDGWDTGLGQLYQLIGSDFVYADPMKLLVFPDNHDRSRIFSLLREDLNLFKASMLFTATVRGIPQFFYGTETLTKSPIIRDDGVLRADFPGGWEGDSVNAFTGKGLSPEQTDAQQYMKKLLNWRKQCTAITQGKLMHYIPENGTYVYFRYDNQSKVMVVINKNKQDTSLDLSRYQGMIQQKKVGRNVITDQQVDLSKPLALKALQSVAIEM